MPTRPPAAPLPMALLRHELPDGTFHFDLLLAASADVCDEDRSVPTWRCETDPLELGVGDACGATPLPPHRGAYLRLQTAVELSGGRGRVEPVRQGSHRTVEAGVEITVPGATGVFEFLGDRVRRVR
ncbi:MAG: hypothetical protein ACKPEA_15525 [Planctomycetota bacterium]